MDDNVVFQPQEPVDAPKDSETKTDESTTDTNASSEHIFDITPDLNIAPVSEESSTKPAVPIADINKFVSNIPTSPTNNGNLQSEVASIFTSRIPDRSNIAPIQTKINAQPKYYPNQAPTITPNIPIKPVNSPPVSPINQSKASASENVRPMHTYENDFAEAMSHNRISTASIAIAESNRRSKAETAGLNTLDTTDTGEKSHSTKNIVLTIVSLLLVTGGVISAYYLYSISPIAPTISQIATTTNYISNSLIPIDSQVNISIDNQTSPNILKKIKAEISKQQPIQTIKEINFTKTENNKTVRVTSAQMLQIMNVQAPDILTRSLAPAWVLGIYNDQNEKKSIFVVTTNNMFQNAFVGMLQWENTMADDLRQFFGIPTYATKNTTPVVLATSTSGKQATSTKITATSTMATSTLLIPQTSEYEPTFLSLRGKFADRIIKNKDVREFIRTGGESLFMYSFINNGTMVISENEDALDEIINRLEKQSFLR